MSSLPRFAVALCATAGLLVPGAIRAEDDPANTSAVPTAHVGDSHGLPETEHGVLDGCGAKPGGLEVSASLLFLQPSTGNMVYATVINPFPFLTPHWSNQVLDPGLSPAFNVGTRYVFDCVGDVALDWTHLNSYDHASTRSTLLGSRKSRIDFVTASPPDLADLLAPNAQFFTTPSSTQLIPSIDARLGANYAIPVGRFGMLTCEAGYQAAVYINAINQYSLSEVENSLTDPTEGIGAVFCGQRSRSRATSSCTVRM
jgi:hypothetical protein